MTDQVQIKCDVCEKTIEVADPCDWRTWMSTRRTGRGHRPNSGGRWSILTGGKFAKDYVLCDDLRCMTSMKDELVSNGMEKSGYALKDCVGFFWPESGALPDRVLHGWPPPKPFFVNRSDQVTLTSNRVFIAGPLMGSGGEQQRNVRDALIDADRVVGAGYVPFIPHLHTFWDLVTPHDRNHWLRINKHWLLCCGALVRRPGASVGSDMEVEWAHSMGVPVFGIEEFLKLRPKFDDGINRWAGTVPAAEMTTDEFWEKRDGGKGVSED